MKSENINHFSISSDNFIFNHSHIERIPMETFKFHTHDTVELLFIKKINGCHIVEDKEYRLTGLDLVVVPPATYHTVKFYDTDSPYERYDIMCSSEIYKGIDIEKIYRNITVINCAHHNIITDIFSKADYYHSVMDTESFINISKLLIRELLYNLTIYDGAEKIQPHFVSPTLSKALEYINNNLYTIESVSQISKALYITDSYLFEIFKNQMKTSPKKYITAKRLHAARDAIAGGEKPTEIYGKFGFGDYASFYRSYVRFFGHAPSQERDLKFIGAKFGINT